VKSAGTALPPPAGQETYRRPACFAGSMRRTAKSVPWELWGRLDDPLFGGCPVSDFVAARIRAWTNGPATPPSRIHIATTMSAPPTYELSSRSPASVLTVAWMISKRVKAGVC